MLFIKRTQCSGDSEPYCSCLTARTAALDIRNNIILPECVGDFKGLNDIGSEGLKWEVILYRSVINGDLSGTGEQPNSRNRVLPTPNDCGWMRYGLPSFSYCVDQRDLLVDSSLDVQDFRHLCRVGVSAVGVHLELLVDSGAQAIVRQHAFHRSLNDTLRVLLHQLTEALDSRSPRVTSVVEICLEVRPFPEHLCLCRVDDDNVVSEISIRGERRFVLSSEDPGHLARQATQDFAICVHEIPLLLDFRIFDVCCELVSHA